MKKLFLLLGCIGGIANAEIQTITIKSLGYGVDRNSAVREALIESLKQYKGVNIDSIRTFTNNIYEFALSSNTEETTSVEIEKSMRSNITEITSGIIQTYTIIENKQLSRNEWEAELEVTFKKYKTPGISPNSRRKLLVYPFNTSQATYAVNNKNIKNTEFARQLAAHIDISLTQSRRFTILDEAYLAQYQQAKKSILSADTALEEKIKLGSRLGADYMVVGTISNAKINKQEEYLDLIDETIVERSAEFSVEYKVIIVATGQSKWSDIVNININPATMRSLTQGKTDNILHRDIMDYIAKIISNAMIANIYPTKIVGVSQRLKNITLGQGGNSFKVGEILDVMALGEEFFDPYTGESLGQDEEKVATAKVTRVLPKFTKAKIISGDIKFIQKGDIVRRAPSQQQTPQKNPQWIGN
jgi:hypothetical protein